MRTPAWGPCCCAFATSRHRWSQIFGTSVSCSYFKVSRAEVKLHCWLCDAYDILPILRLDLEILPNIDTREFFSHWLVGRNLSRPHLNSYHNDKMSQDEGMLHTCGIRALCFDWSFLAVVEPDRYTRCKYDRGIPL
jgi:hypothetical protein